MIAIHPQLEEIRRTLINLDIVMSNRIAALEEAVIENKRAIASAREFVAGVFLNVFYCLVFVGCISGLFIQFIRDGKTTGPMWLLYVLYVIAHIFAISILYGYYRLKN